MDVVVTERNVHNKKLASTVSEHVEYITDLFLNLLTDLESCVLLIEILLVDETDFHKLEQVNVIADKRNNKSSDADAGKYTIDVYYKHKNSFNTTHLTYVVRK